MVSGLRGVSGQRFAVTVRLKIALTILITGLLTAAGVIATVVVAFQRFEHETAYDRANVFLGRVVATDSRVLFNALAGVYADLGFDAAGGVVARPEQVGGLAQVLLCRRVQPEAVEQG